MEIRGRLNEAHCRVFGHMRHTWLYVGKVTEDGALGSYCGHAKRGCPVCPRCNQVTCEHRHLFNDRPLGTNLPLRAS